jgi:hypothetical protein
MPRCLAARHLRGEFAAAATTHKQLRLVCRATRTNPAILDVIRPPQVLHYCGSTLDLLALDKGLDPKRTRTFSESVREHLAQHNIGFAFGSLAAGSEILCAESCLRAGVELHVVLPYNKEEFIETAVRAAGPSWVRRLEACLRRAKSVTFATTDSYQGDNELFSYSCRLAMGMAILRAQNLDTVALHLDCPTGADPDPRGHARNLIPLPHQNDLAI